MRLKGNDQDRQFQAANTGWMDGALK
jgi:hypothetical protein